MNKDNARELWSSKLTFIMAVVGSAVGLANIWRFPYTAGMNGGAAFVFIYIGAVLVLAAPVLIGELMVGRRGQKSPPLSMLKTAEESGGSPKWQYMGIVGIVAAVIIFSTYSIVGGWTLAYSFKVASGLFLGEDGSAIRDLFADFTSNGATVLFWTTLFSGLTTWVSSRGIKSGIEKTVKYLMPLLFIMLLVLVGYAAWVGNFKQAIDFLFTPDFSKVTVNTFISAFGQAFFSLGVGVTNLMAYGAYMDQKTSIPRSSLIIAGTDTFVALLAGLAIFPIIFAFNMVPSEGPGLVFMALPVAFGNMVGGTIFGTIFFLLLFFAALTSALSMMEATVSWFQDKTDWSRRKSAFCAGSISWLLSTLSVLSFSNWSDFYPLNFITIFEGKTFFDIFDYATSTVLMPLGGVFIAIYVGWVLKRSVTEEEFTKGGDNTGYKTWLFLVRYVAPVVLLIIFINLVSA